MVKRRHYKARDEQQAVMRLKQVLQRASEYGLNINWKKSQLEDDEVDVIGYTSNQSDSESLVSGHSGDSGVGVGVSVRRARGSARRCAKPAKHRAARHTRV
ncbi:unnamed protein product [Colias eurytheme]|nr:unnamed protein product [Colias eurytheme]